MTDNTVAIDNASYLLRHGGELSAFGASLPILSTISFCLSWVTLSLGWWNFSMLAMLLAIFASPLLLAFGLITIRAGILEAGTNHERLVALGRSVINYCLLFLLLYCCTLLVTRIFTVLPLGWFSDSIVFLLRVSSFALMCMTLVKSVQLSKG